MTRPTSSAMHVAFVAAIARQDQADKPRIAISLRLLPGFGRHELPVGIARRQVAGKGPDVGNIGYLFWISVDHTPGLVAGHGDELRVPSRSGTASAAETLTFVPVLSR